VEVTGDAARHVPAGDPDALAAALVALEGDEALRADLIRRGEAHVGRFTWDACATGMADLLRGAADRAL
jgi:glycosyltransferase involved in cell wall biosynthesis